LALDGLANVSAHHGAAEIEGADDAGGAGDDRVKFAVVGGFLHFQRGKRFGSVVTAVVVVGVEGGLLIHHLAVGQAGEGVDGAGVDESTHAGLDSGLQDVVGAFYVYLMHRRQFARHDGDEPSEMENLADPLEEGLELLRAQNIALYFLNGQAI